MCQDLIFGLWGTPMAEQGNFIRIKCQLSQGLLPNAFKTFFNLCGLSSLCEKYIFFSRKDARIAKFFFLRGLCVFVVNKDNANWRIQSQPVKWKQMEKLTPNLDPKLVRV